MLYLINSKNENAKKDLRLAYSQGNNTTYAPDIESMARYLSTQYPNNKPTNQRGGNKGNKRKGDDPKSEDKDSNMGGTAGAHVEDTTTNEDTTAPSGGDSIGAQVLETNQTLSCPSRTVDEILGSHPVTDDFWDNTNPTNVYIDTVNSKEKMAGSHITEFHTHEDEQPVVMDLLSQGNQDYDNQHDQQLMTRKHYNIQEHHNPSNPQPKTSVDCKLAIGTDESFSSEAVENGYTTNIMDELATMKRPPNPLGSSIPESTLQRILKR